jgi:cytidine deaminase
MGVAAREAARSILAEMYPEGVCAETSAVSAMAQAGHRRNLRPIGDGEDLCTPCGGCRQRTREFADAETVVHVAWPEGVRERFNLRRTVAGILWPRPSSDRVKGGAHQRE